MLGDIQTKRRSIVHSKNQQSRVNRLHLLRLSENLHRWAVPQSAGESSARHCQANVKASTTPTNDILHPLIPKVDSTVPRSKSIGLTKTTPSFFCKIFKKNEIQPQNFAKHPSWATLLRWCWYPWSSSWWRYSWSSSATNSWPWRSSSASRWSCCWWRCSSPWPCARAGFRARSNELTLM